MSSSTQIATNGPGVAVDHESLLDKIEAPRSARELRLPSGRLLSIDGLGGADRLEVRGRGGEVVLAIVVGEHGPVLSFRSATLELVAEGDLRMEARDVSIHARRDMRVDVAGERHTSVGATDKHEAGRIELQANDDRVAIRAREDVLIDGEHIGLNDDPMPAPFPWSASARDEGRS